jgi:hypothetical protein
MPDSEIDELELYLTQEDYAQEDCLRFYDWEEILEEV